MHVSSNGDLMTDPKDHDEKPEENKEDGALSEEASTSDQAGDDGPDPAVDAGESPDAEGAEDLKEPVADAPEEVEGLAEAAEDAPEDADTGSDQVRDPDAEDALAAAPETETGGEAEAGAETEEEVEVEAEAEAEEVAQQPSAPDTETRLDDALATAPLVAGGAAAAAPAAAAQRVDAQDHDDRHHDDDHHDDHHDEHDEEHATKSFASRVLTWLILLLVGGGVALWGGPKVAPHLPNGLGPVKAWLMPGALETEAQLSALEADVSARFDALPAAVTGDEVSAAVAEAVAAAEARFEDTLQALTDKVEATDGAEVEARLAQIETRLEGLVTQMEALSGISAAADDALSEAQMAELSTFAAAVEGLRAEIGALATSQGGLSQRIDDVEVTVERKLAEAEDEIVTARVEAEQVKNAAVARASLTAIEAATDSGEPFEDALGVLKANTDAPVSEALDAVASTGMTPLGQLRASFADAAHAAIRADLKARDTGSVGGRLASFIEAQVATRSLTPQEGDSTDAILSRAEDALRRDNLAAAVEELKTLAEAPQAALSGWLGRAEARVAALSAIAELRGVLAAEN